MLRLVVIIVLLGLYFFCNGAADDKSIAVVPAILDATDAQLTYHEIYKDLPLAQKRALAKRS